MIYTSGSNDWKIANLRYFNPIGAHPSGLLGEDPQGKPNNIFPLILKVASGELNQLRILEMIGILLMEQVLRLYSCS